AGPAADPARPSPVRPELAGSDRQAGRTRVREDPDRRHREPAAERAAPGEAEKVILRGAPARTAQNMETSLTVPTATSVRQVPVKLLIDNRIVINNHLARARGGKVSFTHVIGFARVKERQ